jgi:transposase InsO family protein
MKKNSLKFQLFNAVGINKEDQSVKLTQAPPIKKNERGKFMVFKKFAVVQADLIYMRKSKKGFEYILVVVDVATRVIDAAPLRGRQSEDVIEGFEQIFKRNYITTDIVCLYTDPGSEFKNDNFHKYMKEKGIDVRHTMTARKGQMGIVEYYNTFFTSTIGTKMTSDELFSGAPSDEWEDMIPKIVKVLNEEQNVKEPKLAEFFKPPRTTLAELNDRLEVGTVVHVRLQQPINHMVTDRKERLVGDFRHGDLRYEKTVTTVTNVIILPNQPIRYKVAKYNNVTFIRKELLVATQDESNKERQNNPLPPNKKLSDVPPPATRKGPVTRSMAKAQAV